MSCPRIRSRRGFSADQPLELADVRARLVAGQVRGDPILDGPQANLDELSDCRLGERLVGDVDIRIASPQRERGNETLASRARITAQQRPPLGGETLEAHRVDPVGVDPQDVAGRLRGQNARLTSSRRPGSRASRSL